ncbi:MAG: PTS sugar transporter subunit IIA [Phycisphaerales bacterium]|nr:PTS sugar transporter subunit IIA [Phycisphaerales bacterium]
MKLSELIASGAVVTQLKSQDRDQVIHELIDALIASNAASGEHRAELLKRVLDRENRGTTGFGRGVAVPHVKHPSVKRMAAAIGLSSTGIEFNSLDKQPVYSVFLLLSPEDRPEEHLLAMEVIFKNLSKETFRRFLRQAGSEAEVRSLLDDADTQQLAG